MLSGSMPLQAGSAAHQTLCRGWLMQVLIPTGNASMKSCLCRTLEVGIRARLQLSIISWSTSS